MKGSRTLKVILFLLNIGLLTRNEVDADLLENETKGRKTELDDLNSLDDDQSQKVQHNPFGPVPYPPPVPYPRCPFCEPTVFSYCFEKRLHDACCCSPFPYYLKSPGLGLPGGFGLQCQYQDCRFLFANSCQESILISECCCPLIKRSLY